MNCVVAVFHRWILNWFDWILNTFFFIRIIIIFFYYRMIHERFNKKNIVSRTKFHRLNFNRFSISFSFFRNAIFFIEWFIKNAISLTWNTSKRDREIAQLCLPPSMFLCFYLLIRERIDLWKKLNRTKFSFFFNFEKNNRKSSGEKRIPFDVFTPPCVGALCSRVIKSFEVH